MEYFKATNFLYNQTNQPFGSETKDLGWSKLYGDKTPIKNSISALKSKQVDNAKAPFVIISVYHLLK